MKSKILGHLSIIPKFSDRRNGSSSGECSPVFNPASPLIDRPLISPRTERELRRACALVVQNAQNEARKSEGNDRLQKHRNEITRLQTHVAQPQSDDSARPHSPVPQLPLHVADTVVADGAAGRNYSSGKAATTHLTPLVATHRPHTSASEVDGLRTNALLPSSGLKSPSRHGQDDSDPSSNNTTSHNTACDPDRFSRSTAKTSLPCSPQRSQRHSQTIVEKTTHGPTSPTTAAAVAIATTTATATGAPGLTRAKSVGAQILRKPIGTTACDKPPGSRGSLKDSVKNYIRPVRSSSPGSSRSDSTDRSGTTASHDSLTWWKGSSVRRKFSDSSLRARIYDAQARNGGTSMAFSHGPDLNRALPALPSLDTYEKERDKRKQKHIAELMLGEVVSKDAESNSRKHSVVSAPGNTPGRTLTVEEERRRRETLQQAVFEKMTIGSITGGPNSPGLLVTQDPIASLNSMERGMASVAAGKPNPNGATFVAINMGSNQKEKKGLRRTLSRLGFGKKWA